MLGEHAAAAAVLRQVLEHDPGNEPAKALLADCESAGAIATAPALASDRG
jgi:hypothetical protein